MAPTGRCCQLKSGWHQLADQYVERGTGLCYSWVNENQQWIKDIVTKAGGKIQPVEWVIPEGIGWTNHAGVKVTFPDGTTFYMDNGFLGGFFTDAEVPNGWWCKSYSED
jgi:hypothetical protein